MAKKVTPKKRARPQSLPGMENRAIKPLEDLATRYAEIRDSRMELTEQEHELKTQALKLMKKLGKTVYKHNGVEILVVTGEDDVKVRVRKSKDEDDQDDERVAFADGIQQTAERRAAVDAEN